MIRLMTMALTPQVRAVNEAGAGIHSGLSVCCHGNTQRNVLRTGRLNQHADAQPQRTATISLAGHWSALTSAITIHGNLAQSSGRCGRVIK